MSTLHCRGCDCLECAPGFPAEATRVYSTIPRRNENGVRKAELFPRSFDEKYRFTDPPPPADPLWVRALIKREAIR
jgi:hypothetical protein